MYAIHPDLDPQVENENGKHHVCNRQTVQITFTKQCFYNFIYPKQVQNYVQ